MATVDYTSGPTVFVLMVVIVGLAVWFTRNEPPRPKP